QCAPCEIRVTVLSFVLGNHAPEVFLNGRKIFLVEFRQGCWLNRWTIHERDNGRVTAAIQYILKPQFQRAELAEFRGIIAHQESSHGVDDRRDQVDVVSSDHNHQVTKRTECSYVSTEERAAQGLGGTGSGWPGQQRLVATHARGISGGEDDPTEARRARHCLLWD